MQDLQTLLNLVQQSRETYAAVFLAVSRYLVPALGAWLLLHCARPLISFRREPEIWAWLKFTDGTQVAVTHWENVIGRAKSSDITVALSTVSRNHAVLTRYDDGSWTITDASSKTGTWVNGERVDIRAIGEGDVISIGGVDMELQPITKRQEQLQSQLRTRGSGPISSIFGLILLTLLHLGIRNIRLGPTLPAFVSPNVLNYLVENFGIAPITTPEEDLKQLLK